MEMNNIMTTNCTFNDTDYDYFRTAEEKKAAEPKLPSDELCDVLDMRWRKVIKETSVFNYGSYAIYRRKKQYPRWVKVKDIEPTKDYYLPSVGKLFHVYKGSDGVWRWTQLGSRVEWLPTHVYDIGPISPPPKAEPEKNEFEEWLNKDLKDNGLMRHWTYKETCQKAWNAALANKQSKEDGEACDP